MAALVPITELEAVNTMLGAIGEQPVDTLTNPGLADVITAVNILHNISREVQNRGWWFNRETNVSLTPNGSNLILLGTNVLHIDSSRNSPYDVIEKTRQLYNLDTKAFTFTEAVECDITYFIAFESLPQSARWYITVRAARIFQANRLGSSERFQYDAQLESEALNALSAVEAESEDNNVLYDEYDTYSIFSREFNP